MNINGLSKKGAPTPGSSIEEALSIINRLNDGWDEIFGLIEEDKGEFIEKIAMPMLGKLGENGISEFGKLLKERLEKAQQGDRSPLTLALMSVQACSLAVCALNAEAGGKILDAWRYTSQANYWLGVTIGRMMAEEGQPESISDFAKRGAVVRHTENRAMKADVFAWLDANMANFKSMDAAAQAATKQQPIAFRTARGWTGEWKKVRSTGTP